MPKIFPVIKRTTVVTGGGGPTASYAEDASVDDHLAVTVANPEDAQAADELAARVALAEDASVDDLFAAIVDASYAEDATADDHLAVMLSNPEDAAVDDALVVTVANPEDASVADDISTLVTLSEDANVNDLVVVAIGGVDVPRTATPDTDPEGDAYTNQASPGTNFGNVNLVVKGKSTLADDERRGFIMVDLTWATGFVSTGSGFAMSFTVSHNGLTSDDIRWSSTRHAARPFTESTVTWNGPPSAGTVVTSAVDLTVATGAAQRKTITIAAGATLDACLGQWLLIRFTAATGAATNNFTVVSRDQGANRPLWAIDLQRGV